MANEITVLTSSRKGVWRIAYRFDIPDSLNDVGVNYRTALKDSGLASVSVLPDGDGSAYTISAAEKTALANGETYEQVETLMLDKVKGANPTERNVKRLAIIRAHYTDFENQVLTKIQNKLRFFGFSTTRA